MESKNNESALIATTNLIDFCSSVEEVMPPLIPLPQVIELNNDLSLYRDSFENNPFDRILKEIQNDYIKKNDPFEMTLEKSCDVNKNSNLNKMSTPKNKENVPLICINDANVNNKFTKETVYCRSPLFVKQDHSSVIFANNGINGKTDSKNSSSDSSFQWLSNSIMDDTLISSDLNNEKKIYNSHKIDSTLINVFNDVDPFNSKCDVSKAEFDDSLLLEANDLVNTFTKLATSSTDICDNSDEDLLKYEPNWSNEIFQYNTENKNTEEVTKLYNFQKEKKLLFNDDSFSENFSSATINGDTKMKNEKIGIFYDDGALSNSPILKDDLLTESKLNKSDFVNTRRKKLFNRSLSLVENVESYKSAEKCKNSVKSENAVKLLENITMILKADDNDLKQRETLGENLIHSLAQLLNLDTHNISNCMKKHKSDSSDEFQHNSTESIEDNSVSEILAEESNFNTITSSKTRDFSQKLYVPKMAFEKNKLNNSKVKRSQSLNISSINGCSNTSNIPHNSNKSIQKLSGKKMFQSNSTGNLQDLLQPKCGIDTHSKVKSSEGRDLKNKNIKSSDNLFHQTSSFINVHNNPVNISHNKSSQKLPLKKIGHRNSEGNLQQFFKTKSYNDKDLSATNKLKDKNVKDESNISQHVNKLKMKFNTQGTVDLSIKNVKRSPLKAILPISNMMKSKDKKEEIIRKKNCKAYLRNSLYTTPPKKIISPSLKLKTTTTPNQSTVFSKLKPICQSTPNIPNSSKEIRTVSAQARRSIENLRNSNRSSTHSIIEQIIPNVTGSQKKSMQKSSEISLLSEADYLENAGVTIINKKSKLGKLSNGNNNSISKLKSTFSNKINKTNNNNGSFIEAGKTNLK